MFHSHGVYQISRRFEQSHFAVTFNINRYKYPQLRVKYFVNLFISIREPSDSFHLRPFANALHRHQSVTRNTETCCAAE